MCCPAHLSSSPVQLTCPAHLSSSPVQLTCPAHLSSSPAGNDGAGRAADPAPRVTSAVVAPDTVRIRRQAVNRTASHRKRTTGTTNPLPTTTTEVTHDIPATRRRREQPITTAVKLRRRPTDLTPRTTTAVVPPDSVRIRRQGTHRGGVQQASRLRGLCRLGQHANQNTGQQPRTGDPPSSCPRPGSDRSPHVIPPGKSEISLFASYTAHRAHGREDWSSRRRRSSRRVRGGRRAISARRRSHVWWWYVAVR